MSSSIPMPKIAPPQLSSLRRVPKPVFKVNVPLAKPTINASENNKPNTLVKSLKLPKPNTNPSFLENNMFPIVIGVLGVSYLILRNTKK